MSLEFVQITSIAPVAAYLADVIGKKLRHGEHVLWLVPGGSAIAVAAETSRQLRNTPLEDLTLTLTDERFGAVGHPDSNWPQLERAGLSLPGATMLPVLHGDDLQATVRRFAQTLQTELAKPGYRIGLFGIGADGHTAGILSHSGAVAEAALAHGYDAGNFVRVTMTPAAIGKLDEVVVYATGEEKRAVLEQLEIDIPVATQPAQALKQAAAVTIYNDLKGESA